MRRAIGRLLALAGLGLVSPLAAQDGVTLAVLPFENTGSYGQDKESFAALEVGLPALLTLELARRPAIAVVDRARLRARMAKPDEPRPRLDAAAAAAVGKSVGASHVIMGNFVDFYGKVRVNARVVETGTARILAVVSNDDRKLQDRTELHRIVRHVADRAARALPGVGPADSIPLSLPVPTEALIFYSRGLLHSDRGDTARAAEFYRRALAAYPEFTAARDALRQDRAS